MSIRPHLRLGLWLALVGFVLATLLPAISRAWAPEGPDWAAVCSSGGLQDKRPGDPDPDALTHCPLCLWQVQSTAFDRPALVGAVVRAATLRLPMVTCGPPLAAGHRRAHRTRGPPQA